MLCGFSAQFVQRKSLFAQYLGIAQFFFFLAYKDCRNDFGNDLGWNRLYCIGGILQGV